MEQTMERIDPTHAYDAPTYSIAIVSMSSLTVVFSEVDDPQPSMTTTMGSFTRDPIGYEGSEWSLYEYCADNPLGNLDPLGLEVFRAKLVGKSFIDGMVRGIGTLPNNTPGWYLTQLLFRAFANVTAATFQEHPNTDAKDRVYRLYTELNLEFKCTCDGKIEYARITSTATDAGVEPGGFSGTTNLSYRIWVTSPTVGEVGWRGWGRPDPRVEWTFQSILVRTSVNIWHTAVVEFHCPSGVVSTKSFRGSDFPSHKMWINNAQSGYKRQGLFSSLWRSDRILGPTFVTEDGTGPFTPQFGVDPSLTR